MTDNPDDAMQYELHNVSTALAKVRVLVEKTKADTKAHEFYTTIEEAMFALQHAMNEAAAMKRSYSNMIARVDILEHLLLMRLPAKELVTHDILDRLKSD